MDTNIKIYLLVCAFAAIREFRPIEPFITEFLTGPDGGFTEEEVVQKIFIIWTYSSFVLIVIIFLITDYLRYKPIIIADGITGILTYALLLGKPSVLTMQIEQCFFGFFYSSDTAYYTYMYAKIEDKSLYNKITGFVRASVLFGKFCSALSSQLFVSFGDKSGQKYLVYCSVGGMTLTTILAFFFPPVKKSVYFHRKTEFDPITSQNISQYGASTTQICVTDSSASQVSVSTENFSTIPKTEKKPGLKTVFRYLLTDFKTSFSNKQVIEWAFWWSVAAAGSSQVLTYCQVIWKTAIKTNYNNDMKSLNGVVDCIYCLLSAIASYNVGKLDVNWTKHSNLLLTVGSAMVGVVVMFTSFLTNLWLLYLCHILFGLIFHTMLTIAEFEIAKHVKETCYGLVFGFINFIAICISTIWTALIVQDTFFSFNIQRQFEFCGVYFLAIGLFYLLRALKNLVQKKLT